MAKVMEDNEWFGAFHASFSECARYNAGIGECTMAVNDEVYDGKNEEPLMADEEHLAYSTSLELCNAHRGELDVNDVVNVVNSGDKSQQTAFPNMEARGRAKEGAEEIEVVPFKLSGKSLAVAQTNATIKLNMLTELASKKSYERAEMMQEKARLKRELLERDIASRDEARMHIINARNERDSKKRTAEMCDHYMKVGMSPVSTTTKAKMAEKLLNDN